MDTDKSHIERRHRRDTDEVEGGECAAKIYGGCRGEQHEQYAGLKQCMRNGLKTQ